MHVPSTCAECVPQQHSSVHDSFCSKRQACSSLDRLKLDRGYRQAEGVGYGDVLPGAINTHLCSAHVLLRHAAFSAELPAQQGGAAHQLPGGGS